MEQMENKSVGEQVMPLNEVKVVFLGDGETGKSHILARLLRDGEKLDSTDFDGQVTPGIVIKDKEYDLDGQKIQVHFWNFGGQEILHSMHRMFLTDRTLYVVIINVRDDTQDDRARYWLHNIKSFAPGAPVLLVLNKIDQNPNASIDLPDLRRMYDGLKAVVRMSALEYDKDQFNKVFTDALMEQVKALGTHGVLWPASWLKLKKGLETMQTHYIHGGEYEDLCEESGVEGERENLLHWFNDLGISFCYTGNANLEDYVILKPEWLTNAIYIILFNKCEEAKNGIIPHSAIKRMLRKPAVGQNEVRRVLADVFYNPQEVDYVLDVIRKFRLSFQVRNDVEFIPALCQRESMGVAEEYAADHNALEFTMEYEYLPDNVIHRLMVEMRNDLDTEKVWRTGARFVQRGTSFRAVVKSEGNLLRIFVRSDNPIHKPNTYLHIIKDNLDRINADMKLQAPFCEVIYKADGIRETFDYEELLAALKDGETTYRSRKLRRRIPIEDILNQSGRTAEVELNKLRDNIAMACMQIQGNPIYWKSSEDDRNTAIRDFLRAKDYIVNDQSFQGVNVGWGLRASELDLDIRRESDTPWIICEALNISGKENSNWNAHLKKLLDNYNPSGLNHLFLLTYVECDKDDFANFFARFSEHIRWFDPGFAMRTPNTFRFVPTDFSGPYLQIMQCSYDIGGAVVTVYYYFVQIGVGNNDASAAQPKLPETKPNPAEEKPKVPEETSVCPVQREKAKAPGVPNEDTLVLSEYRVVILGDSEAGKSHILARLKNPELEHTAFLGGGKDEQTKPTKKEKAVFTGDTTDGIDIASMTYTINGSQVRVNYWDFGGQEILHSMQRLFLTQQALYIIVLNTRNDNQDGQADFWLRYVQTYARGAPVILVLNKIDQNPRAALNMSMLLRRFNNTLNICDVVRISARDCRREQFQTDFIDTIVAHISQRLNSDCCFTARELRIRERLHKYRVEQQLITFDAFRSLCNEEGVTDKKTRDALRKRFKRAGVMVYFQTKIRMLLEPEWITRAIFRLLKKRDDLTENGILSKDDIEELFLTDPKMKYQTEHIEFILQVMRETGLSFPYQSPRHGDDENEPTEFIPMLCRREEPQEIGTMESEREPVELQMHYDYLPPSVIHQLMVDRHQELDVEKAWLNGAVFHDNNGCTAVVRRDTDVLTIFVWSDDPAYSIAYVDDLKKHIDRIALSDLHNAIAREVRIGYRLNGTTEYFNYNRLLNAKACDIQYTVSGRSHNRIAVLDILEQTDRSEKRDLEKLLQTTLTGCMELQDDRTFWFRGKALQELEKYLPKMDENARNRQLRRTLGSQFIVKDQTQSGESASSLSSGELDLAIFTKPDIHWAIMEALNITGTNADSEKRWKEHLHRMMERYNKKGLRHLLLVSYLNCPEAQFEQIHSHYFDLLHSFTPDGLGCEQNSCEIVHMKECPEAIRISRADYSGGRGVVSVYHFLVHIPEIRSPVSTLPAL